MPENEPLSPPFPRMQGELTGVSVLGVALPLREAILVALGLAPGSWPLRWLNNELVTEPASNRTTADGIVFWKRRLECGWLADGGGEHDIDLVAFIDWVTRAFGRPEWVSTAESLRLWPPRKPGDRTLLEPGLPFDLETMGPEAFPDAIQQSLDHWLRYDSWSHSQAIFALLGIDPDTDKTSFSNRNAVYYEPRFHKLQFLNGMTFFVPHSYSWPEVWEVSRHGKALVVKQSQIGAYLKSLARVVAEMNDVWSSGIHPPRAEFQYYLNWAATKCFAVSPAVVAHLEKIPAARSGAGSSPVSKRLSQTQTILGAISDLGIDPLALPKVKPGHAGIKAQIWERLERQRTIFASRNVFDKAWDELRKHREIRDAGSPSA